MAKALIVVDVQNDFCEGGSLAVEGGSKVATDIANLLRTNHGYDIVVATLDWHNRNGDNGGHFTAEGVEPDYADTWPVHCVAETIGAAFAPPIDSTKFVEIFTKGQNEPAYSGFEGTGTITGLTLKDFLVEQAVTEVDVVGLAYDYCVKSTAVDAAIEGFDTKVLTDLTASVSRKSEIDATVVLASAGVVIV